MKNILFLFALCLPILIHAQPFKLVVPVGHNAPLDFASYSPDGKYIATTGMDHNIKIWEAATGYLLHTLPGHSARITKAKFSNSGKILASVSYDGTAKLRDAEISGYI